MIVTIKGSLLKKNTHRKVAEIAEVLFFLLFADPGGIGFAFHRAGTPKSKMTQPFG